MEYHGDHFDPAKHFWVWFLCNINDLNQVGHKEEEHYYFWMNEIEMHLRAFCNMLRFELEESEDKKTKRFIISACMEKRYFKKVQELADGAPDIKGWEVVSLIPPRPLQWLAKAGYPQWMELGKRMWFWAHKVSGNGQMGFVFYVESELPEGDMTLRLAVILIVRTLMGERAYGGIMDDFEIVSQPSIDPVEMKLKPVIELSVYLASLQSVFEIGGDGKLREKKC